MSTMSKLFIAHPAAVGESYFEHMRFAFRFSGRLFRAGFAAITHGFVPGICETTASEAILAMNDEIRARRKLMAE
jgi:Family of unknown function (DUF6356)